MRDTMQRSGAESTVPRRRRARRAGVRAALLASSALVAATAAISFAALTVTAPTAWAQATGGAGGFGVFESGGNGGNPGQPGSPTIGTAGGAAGTAPSGNGGNASPTLAGSAGSGGGGGANGATASPTGGNGGNGGNSGCPPCSNSSGGGGGGAGGTGINITSSFTNSGTVKGGTGGNGGTGGAGTVLNNAGNGGGGGGGGFGIIATTSGLTITNNAGASILGGNGGAGGAGSTGTPSQTGTPGAAGAGGVGIQGSGITIVNDGTILGGLSGDGVTRADAIVFTGGTNLLTGTGTVGSFTMISGSTFAPGSGTAGSSMTVNGNLAFQSGAFYLVQVNPTAASSTNVSGTAALGGASVQTVFAPGSYVSRQYTILHSGGLIGTFSGVSGNVPAGFSESLSYTGTDVILNLTAILAQPSGLACSFSVNQCNVANAINNFFNNGGALPPNFLAIFGLTGGNLANALTLLSGEAATGAQQGAFQLGSQFLNLMLDPFVDGRGGVGGAGGPAIGFAPERPEMPDGLALAYAKAMKAPVYKAPPIYEPRWSVWGGAYGGANRTGGDPAVVGSHDLSARAGGVAAGLDYRVTPNTVVGFALAGGGTNWSLANGLGGGSSDAFQLGLYGATRAGAAYLAGGFAYTSHWLSTDRFAFAGDHLTAQFNAQSFGARVEGGYRYAQGVGGVGGVGITPYAAVQAQSFHTPTYSETDVNGGGFGLVFNARTASASRSELGARFDYVVPISVYQNAVLTLRGRLAWAHDWVSDPSLAAVFQALPGASFIVNGATPAKDSALVSAGAELRLVNGVALAGKFDGEFASRAQTYAGTGTLRVNW
jgi:outer membrane autotransporter protein